MQLPHTVERPKAALIRPQQLKFWCLAVGTFILCCIGAAYDALSNPTLTFPFDDAYITLHNARTLLSGHDNNFLETPALIGATSALHLLLIAALSWILPSLEASSFAVAWVSFFGYLLALLFLAQKRGLSMPHCFLLLALAATIGKTQYQMLNGLETGAAMMLIVATLYSLEFKSARAKLVTGLFLGLLPALRPELIVLSLLLGADAAINAFEARNCDSGIFRKELNCLLAGVFIGSTPWVAWYYATTGHLGPTTISAKTMFFAEGCASAAQKLEFISNAATNFISEIGIAACLTAGLFLRRRGRFLAIFILVFLAAYYLRFPGALGHYWYRYWYILIPILFFGGIELLRSKCVKTRVVSSFILIAGLLYSLQNYQKNADELTFGRDATTQEQISLANWINVHLEADNILLVHDVGHIAWSTQNRLVDLVGLKTPRNIPIHKKITYPSCGKNRYAAIQEIAASFRVSHLVVLEGWDGIFGITRALKAGGWQLDKIRPGRYAVYRLTPPQIGS